MSFQQQVNLVQAPGVAGDFASANPRASVVAGPGALTAGVGGAIVGRFGWADVNGLVTNTGQGVPTGFIHRENNALITTFLADNSMVVPVGLALTLFSQGDFWAKTGSTATVGQKAFASLIDGSVQTAAAGATIAGASLTASTATNVLTVTAVTGVIAVGSILAGGSIAVPTYITAQTSGTAGGTGTYTLSTTPGTVTSEAMTTTNFIETSFKVDSAGASGELIKISTWG